MGKAERRRSVSYKNIVLFETVPVQHFRRPPVQLLPAPAVHRRCSYDQFPLVHHQIHQRPSDLPLSRFSEAHPLSFLSLTAPGEEHETEVMAPLYARVTLTQRECCTVKYCHHDLHAFMSVWALISPNLTGSFQLFKPSFCLT